MYENAVWIGDLDVSGSERREDYDPLSVGSLNIMDSSSWKGKVISGDRSVGLFLNGESTWQMTGDSKIAYLDAGESTISFEPHSIAGQFSTLTGW